MKYKKIITLFIFTGLIIILFGLTYSFFNFTDYSNELNTNNGNVYMKMNTSNNITLNNVFPESYNKALYQNGVDGTLRTDNIIEFTVLGNNTYGKPIYYEIDLMYGNEVSGKNRIDDKYLKFELLDITDSNNIEEIISDVSYNSLDNKRIFVDTISNNDTNYSRTYRLRMWYDENIIISDTDPLADFKASNNEYQTENSSLPLYTNYFSSIKVKVYGDFEEKENPNPKPTPASCFTYYVYDYITLDEYDISCGTDVIIPKKINGLYVKEITSSTFRGVGITSVKIPESFTEISISHFAANPELKSLYIPKSVTTIKANSSASTLSFESLVVDPDNPVFDSRENCNAVIHKAKNWVVLGCKNTVFPSSVVGIANYAFNGAKDLGDFVIPSNISFISIYAFWGCVGLTNLLIESGVTSIGAWAFLECTDLESVIIPSSVTRIEQGVFNKCNKLKDVYVSWSNPSIVSFRDLSIKDPFPVVTRLHIPTGKTSVYQSNQVFGNTATFIYIIEDNN